MENSSGQDHELVARWETRLRELSEKERRARAAREEKAAFCDGGALPVPPGPRTLIEALVATARDFPEQGLTLLERNGEKTSILYPALLESARGILSGLRQSGLKAGDRVILQCPELRDHFAAFWACVLGGIAPVTVAIPPSYSEDNAIVRKLHNAWKLLEGPAILTSSTMAGSVSGLAALLRMESLRVLAVEELKTNPPAEELHAAAPEEIVFFQLTSGSTGVPKCIPETHKGIIAHIHGSAHCNGYSSENVTVNWLPLDHVVPILTFHLKDVYLGCQQVHAATDLVLAHPLRWLEWIEEHRATHSWAPNFGYKLASDELVRHPERKFDLSSMRFFMNAGEQVTVPVVKQFLKAVAPLGVEESAMQPAFGMAEVCTCMTYQNHFSLQRSARRFLKSSLPLILQETAHDDAGSVQFVSLGPPMPGVQIRITDAKNQLLPENCIGLLQIRGDVVTPGYLHNPAANTEAFVGEAWFNSGDLGFISGGELYLTGREKEMIIIRGANFYCYEIEDVVNEVQGVLPTFAAAAGVADDRTGTEGLAIFFVAERGADKRQVAQAIRTRVATTMGISPFCVVPLEKSRFAKTTSGKIQRRQMKQALEAGEYRKVLDDLNARDLCADFRPPQSETERRLAGIWEEALERNELGISDTFFENGGDSLRAARILARVRDEFQLELPFRSLFEEAATIEKMAQRIDRREQVEASILPPVQRAPREGRLRLSTVQERIWLMQQMHPDSSLFNVSRAVHLKGNLNPGAFRRSLNQIFQRHEILRTTFHLQEGAVCQVIQPRAGINLPLTDLCEYPLHERAGRARFLAAEEGARPFDLENGPLVRARFFRIQENEHVLLIAFHQLVVDGWSMTVFFDELDQLYSSISTGKEVVLAPLPIQYADYAQWQQAHADAPLFRKEIDYWKEKLAGADDLELRTDLPRDEQSGLHCLTEKRVIPGPVSEEIAAFNRREGVTLFMTLVAAYQVLLWHYGGRAELPIGSAVGHRNRKELEPLIGFMVNTVVLRAGLTPELTFRDWLRRVKETALEAFGNSAVPFDKVVEAIQPRRQPGRTPLFQAWFSFFEPMPPFEIGDLAAQSTHLPPAAAQFDLSLFVVEGDPEFTFYFEYRTGLFEPGTIRRMVATYERILRRAIEAPELPLGDLRAELELIIPPQAAPQPSGRENASREELQRARRKPIHLE